MTFDEVLDAMASVAADGAMEYALMFASGNENALRTVDAALCASLVDDIEGYAGALMMCVALMDEGATAQGVPPELWPPMAVKFERAGITLAHSLAIISVLDHHTGPAEFKIAREAHKRGAMKRFWPLWCERNGMEVS